MVQDLYNYFFGGVLDWESFLFCVGYVGALVLVLCIGGELLEFFIALIKRFIYPAKKED